MKNNKGFMMAEVVVVSAIIIVTLTSLYVSYNKIISLYNQRIDYYDVRTLYELDEYRKNIDFHGKYNEIVQVDTNSTVLCIRAYKIKKGTYSTQSFMNNISQTFKDYLLYLKENYSDYGDYDYTIILERCTDNKKDNCKYAHLGVD